MDVTPRPAEPAPQRRRFGGKGLVPALAGVAVVVALGFVLANGLRDATVFFYNVDEGLEKREELGDKRVRLQGGVVPGTLVNRDNGLSFDLTYNDATIRVEHRGNPPDLDTWDRIPVVVEGTFAEGGEGAGAAPMFASDNILVRHDNTYEEQNPDRLDEADRNVERELTGADTP